jgi:hypothetical protein
VREKTEFNRGQAKTESKEEISPKISNLMGTIKLPADFDYKNALTKGLEKKYK